MSKHLVAALAAALTLAAAGQASATIYNLNFTGQVTAALDFSSADGPSFLGPAASLVGQAFTANVVFDNALPGAGHSSNIFSDMIYGQGMVTTTVTLAGQTFTLGATAGSDYRADYGLDPSCSFNCNTGMFQLGASNETIDATGLYNLDYINLGGFDTEIHGLAHTVPDYTNPPVNLYGFMALFQQQQYGPLDTIYDTEINIRIDSITGGDRWTGAPEPGAWALMLLGFGGLGAALRARRREALAA